MREIMMKKNYAKTFKRLAILAVLLAVFSAIALPLSFSQQIQDLTAIMQSEPSQPALQHDKHDAHQEFDHEEWWRKAKSLHSPLPTTQFSAEPPCSGLHCFATTSCW